MSLLDSWCRYWQLSLLLLLFIQVQIDATPFHKLLAADSTSTLTCDVTSALVGSSFTCKVYPRQSGIPVSGSTSSFPVTLSGISGTSAYTGPSTGTSLAFTVSAFSTTGVMTISTAMTAASVTIGIADVPDSTSTVSCTAAYVMIRNGFTCTSVARKAGAPIHALTTAFTPAVDTVNTDAEIVAYRPATQFYASTASGGTAEVGTQITFTGLLSYVSGKLSITDGVSSTNVTILITAIPDSTSTFSCNQSSTMQVGSVFQCYMIPRQHDVPILALLSTYAMDSAPTGAATFSPVTAWMMNSKYTNAVGVIDRAVVTVTSGAISRYVTIHDGLSLTTHSWLIWDTPDSTSSFTCSNTIVYVGNNITCQFVPRVSNRFIWAPYYLLNFTLRQHSNTSASSANVTAVSYSGSTYSEFGGIFNVSGASLATMGSSGFLSMADQGIVNFQYSFILTASTTSAAWSLFSSATPASDPFYFIVVDNADQTSTMLCAETWVHTNAPLPCAITPKKNGVLIFAPATDFAALRVNDTLSGSFNLVKPTYASVFNVIFTAFSRCGYYDFRLFNPQSVASTSVLVLTTPDSTTTIVCSVRAMNITASTVCTVYPNLVGVSVPTLFSYFTWRLVSNSLTVANTSSLSALQAILPTGSYQAHSFGTTLAAANQPLYAYYFTFTFTAGSVSELVYIDNAFTLPSLLMVVTDKPDSTSTVSCTSSALASRQYLNCATRPQRSSIPIYSYTSYFGLNVVNALGSSAVSYGLALGGGLDGTSYAAGAANGTLSAYTLNPIAGGESANFTTATWFNFTYRGGVVADRYLISDSLSAIPFAVNVSVDASCVRAAQLEASQATCNTTYPSAYPAPALNSLPVPFVPSSCTADLTACGNTCFGSGTAFIWSNPSYVMPSQGSSCPNAACATCVAAAYTACLAPAVAWPFKSGAATILKSIATLQASCQAVSNAPTPAAASVISPFSFVQIGNASASNRPCSDLATQILTQCGLSITAALNASTNPKPYANVTVTVPSVCSPDCATLFLGSGFASSCVWAAVAPNLASSQITSLATFASQCSTWNSCNGYTSPLSFSNTICNAVSTRPCGPHQIASSCSPNNLARTCSGPGELAVSGICPVLGWLPLPATLANISSPTNWTLPPESPSYAMLTAVNTLLNVTASSKASNSGLNSVTDISLATTAVLLASYISLSPQPMRWPSIDTVAALPDVCTFACASAWLIHHTNCIASAVSAYGGLRVQAALSFRDLCQNRARNYPSGRKCMLREALVQSTCGTTWDGVYNTASYWQPPLATPTSPLWTSICTYACADVWNPFMEDCLQYASPFSAGVISFNRTCDDGRRRVPDATTDLTVFPLSDTTIAAQWSIPATHGVPILTYQAYVASLSPSILTSFLSMLPSDAAAMFAAALVDTIASWPAGGLDLNVINAATILSRAGAAANSGTLSMTHIWSAWAVFTANSAAFGALTWNLIYSGEVSSFNPATQLSALTAGSVYVLRVRSTSSLGASAYFTGRPFTTRNAAPSSSPSSLAVSSSWALDSSRAGADVRWTAAATRTLIDVRIDAVSVSASLPSGSQMCPLTGSNSISGAATASALSTGIANPTPVNDFWAMSSQWPLPFTSDSSVAWSAGASLWWPYASATPLNNTNASAFSLASGVPVCLSMLPALSAALVSSGSSPATQLTNSFAFADTAVSVASRWTTLCETDSSFCDLTSLPPGSTVSIRARSRWSNSTGPASSFASSVTVTLPSPAAPALAPMYLTVAAPDPFIVNASVAVSSVLGLNVGGLSTSNLTFSWVPPPDVLSQGIWQFAPAVTSYDLQIVQISSLPRSCSVLNRVLALAAAGTSTSTPTLFDVVSSPSSHAAPVSNASSWSTAQAPAAAVSASMWSSDSGEASVAGAVSLCSSAAVAFVTLAPSPSGWFSAAFSGSGVSATWPSARISLDGNTTQTSLNGLTLASASVAWAAGGVYAIRVRASTSGGASPFSNVMLMTLPTASYSAAGGNIAAAIASSSASSAVSPSCLLCCSSATNVPAFPAPSSAAVDSTTSKLIAPVTILLAIDDSSAWLLLRRPTLDVPDGKGASSDGGALFAVRICGIGRAALFSSVSASTPVVLMNSSVDAIASSAVGAVLNSTTVTTAAPASAVVSCPTLLSTFTASAFTVSADGSWACTFWTTDSSVRIGTLSANASYSIQASFFRQERAQSSLLNDDISAWSPWSASRTITTQPSWPRISSARLVSGTLSDAVDPSASLTQASISAASTSVIVLSLSAASDAAGSSVGTCLSKSLTDTLLVFQPPLAGSTSSSAVTDYSACWLTTSQLQVHIRNTWSWNIPNLLSTLASATSSSIASAWNAVSYGTSPTTSVAVASLGAPASWSWLAGAGLSIPSGPLLARTRVAFRASSSIRSAAAVAANSAPSAAFTSDAAAARALTGAWSAPLLGSPTRTSSTALLKLRPLWKDLQIIRDSQCVGINAPRSFLATSTLPTSSAYSSITWTSYAASLSSYTPAWQVIANVPVATGFVLQLPTWASSAAALEQWRSSLPSSLQSLTSAFSATSPTGSSQLAISCSMSGGSPGAKLSLLGVLQYADAATAETEFTSSSASEIGSAATATGSQFSTSLPNGAWFTPAADGASFVYGIGTSTTSPATALLLGFASGSNTHGKSSNSSSVGFASGGAGISVDAITCSLVLQLPVSTMATQIASSVSLASALQSVQAQIIPFDSSLTLTSTGLVNSTTMLASSAAGLGLSIDSVTAHLYSEPASASGIATLQGDANSLLYPNTASASSSSSWTFTGASTGSIGTLITSTANASMQLVFGSHHVMHSTLSATAASTVNSTAMFTSASICSYASLAATSSILSNVTFPAIVPSSAFNSWSVLSASGSAFAWSPSWASTVSLPLQLPRPLNGDSVWTVDFQAPQFTGLQLVASSSAAAAAAAALAVVSFSPSILPSGIALAAQLGSVHPSMLNAAACVEASAWLSTPTSSNAASISDLATCWASMSRSGSVLSSSSIGSLTQVDAAASIQNGTVLPAFSSAAVRQLSIRGPAWAVYHVYANILKLRVEFDSSVYNNLRQSPIPIPSANSAASSSVEASSMYLTVSMHEQEAAMSGSLFSGPTSPTGSLNDLASFKPTASNIALPATNAIPTSMPYTSIASLTRSRSVTVIMSPSCDTSAAANYPRLIRTLWLRSLRGLELRFDRTLTASTSVRAAVVQQSPVLRSLALAELQSMNVSASITSAVNSLGALTTWTDCRLFFDDNTLLKLGSNPTCQIIDSTLRLLLGAQATLLPTQYLGFRGYPETSLSAAQSYLRACPESPVGAVGALDGAIASPLSVLVPWPLDAMRTRPNIRLEAAAIVALCQPLRIEVAHMTSVGQRVPTFLWSFSSPELLPAGYSLTSLQSARSLLIPTARLQAGTRYSIGVSVRNFLNVSSVEAVHTFVVQPQPLPLITIQGPATRTLLQSSQLRWSAQLTPPLCIDAADAEAVSTNASLATANAAIAGGPWRYSWQIKLLPNAPTASETATGQSSSNATAFPSTSSTSGAAFVQWWQTQYSASGSYWLALIALPLSSMLPTAALTQSTLTLSPNDIRRAIRLLNSQSAAAAAVVATYASAILSGSSASGAASPPPFRFLATCTVSLPLPAATTATAVLDLYNATNTSTTTGLPTAQPPLSSGVLVSWQPSPLRAAIRVSSSVLDAVLQPWMPGPSAASRDSAADMPVVASGFGGEAIFQRVAANASVSSALPGDLFASIPASATTGSIQQDSVLEWPQNQALVLDGSLSFDPDAQAATASMSTVTPRWPNAHKVVGVSDTCAGASMYSAFMNVAPGDECWYYEWSCAAADSNVAPSLSSTNSEGKSTLEYSAPCLMSRAGGIHFTAWPSNTPDSALLWTDPSLVTTAAPSSPYASSAYDIRAQAVQLLTSNRASWPQATWTPSSSATAPPAYDASLLLSRAQTLLNSSALLIVPASTLPAGRYEFTLRTRKGLSAARTAVARIQVLIRPSAVGTAPSRSIAAFTAQRNLIASSTFNVSAIVASAFVQPPSINAFLDTNAFANSYSASASDLSASMGSSASGVFTLNSNLAASGIVNRDSVVRLVAIARDLPAPWLSPVQLCNLRWSMSPAVSLTAVNPLSTASPCSPLSSCWSEVESVTLPQSGVFAPVFDTAAINNALEIHSTLTVRLSAFRSTLSDSNLVEFRASLDCGAAVSMSSDTSNFAVNVSNVLYTNSTSMSATLAAVSSWPHVRTTASVSLSFPQRAGASVGLAGVDTSAATSPPSGDGWISVAPSAGVAYQTAFTLTANGWANPSDALSGGTAQVHGDSALRYQFFIRAASFSETQLRGSSSLSFNSTTVNQAFAISTATGLAAWPFPLFPSTPQFSNLSTPSGLPPLRIPLSAASTSSSLVGVALPAGNVLVEVCVWSEGSQGGERCSVSGPIVVASPSINTGTSATDVWVAMHAAFDEWNRTCQLDGYLAALSMLSPLLNAQSPPPLLLSALKADGTLSGTLSTTTGLTSSAASDAVILLSARKRALVSLLSATTDAAAQMQCRLASAVVASGSTDVLNLAETLTEISSGFDPMLVLSSLNLLTLPALAQDASSVDAALDTLGALFDGHFSWTLSSTASNIVNYQSKSSQPTSASKTPLFSCFTWPSASAYNTTNVSATCAFTIAAKAIVGDAAPPSLLHTTFRGFSQTDSIAAFARSAFGVLENIARSIPSLANVPTAVSISTDAALQPNQPRASVNAALTVDSNVLAAQASGVQGLSAVATAVDSATSVHTSASAIVDFTRSAGSQTRAAADASTDGLIVGSELALAFNTTTAISYSSLFRDVELQSNLVKRFDATSCNLAPINLPGPPALPATFTTRQSRVLIRLVRAISPLQSYLSSHSGLLSRTGDRIETNSSVSMLSSTEWSVGVVRVWDSRSPFATQPATVWVPSSLQASAAAAPVAFMTPTLLSAYWNVSYSPADIVSSPFTISSVSRVPDSPRSRMLPAYVTSTPQLLPRSIARVSVPDRWSLPLFALARASAQAQSISSSALYSATGSASNASSVAACALGVSRSACSLSSIDPSPAVFAPATVPAAIDLWSVYVPATAFPSPTLAYSSVLLVNVSLPLPFSAAGLAPSQSLTDAALAARTSLPSVLPSPTDFTSSSSPWSPVLAMASALPAPVASFTVNNEGCLPPACYLNCFVIQMNNFSTMSASEIATLVSGTSTALNSRLQWQRIPSNQTLQTMPSCQYQSIVQCSLPLFNFTSPVAITGAVTNASFRAAFGSSWKWLRSALQPQPNLAVVVLSTPIPPLFLFGYSPPVAASPPVPTDLGPSVIAIALGTLGSVFAAIGSYLYWRHKRQVGPIDAKSLMYDDEEGEEKPTETETGVQLKKRRLRKRDKEIRALLKSMPLDELDALDAQAQAAGFGGDFEGVGSDSRMADDDDDEYEDDEEESVELVGISADSGASRFAKSLFGNIAAAPAAPKVESAVAQAREDDSDADEEEEDEDDRRMAALLAAAANALTVAPTAAQPTASKAPAELDTFIDVMQL